MKEITITNKATIKANGHLHTSRCKPIICIETGEVFTSMTDAAETYGVNIANVSNAVRGVQRTCKGKHFCYLSESLENLDAIVERLRTTSAMEDDARKWREHQAEQERLRIEEELRLEAERLAEEKRQADIAKVRAKIARLENLCSVYMTKHNDALSLKTEAERELASLLAV